MNIWFFGDSFAMHSPHDPWSWVESVRISTGIKIRPNALSGSSLEWTYHRFEECRDRMEEGDVMIACLTGFDRRWFFLGLPECGSACSMESPKAIKRLSAEERQAALGYYRYLDNDALPRLHLLNWIDLVDYFVAARNVRCLMIPSFPGTAALIQQHRGRWKNVDFCDVDLFSVSVNEWQDPGKMSPSDRRVNHLTRDNHQILAGKIYEWIKNGSGVTADGFLSGIISPEISSRDGWETMLLS